MKCPKCGHENPNDQLFCEKCDWKVTEKPRKDRSEYMIYIAMTSVILGLASIILLAYSALNNYDPNFGVWSAVFGGIGLVIGSYAQTYIRIIDYDARMKKVLIVVAGIGLILSILGMIIGIYFAAAK